MAKEIKQRIVLEGEKQYNQAIKEAQRNLKTLKSELKAETAEMGRNATEQQKAEARAKSLKQQIAEQEKIVKTLRDALAQAKEQYGDNAEVVHTWEQKLNNARTTLANMRNDLEGVGEGFKTVNTDAAAATVATKSVADALGSLGSAGDSVSSAIENVFTGMIDTVTDAMTELWDLISGTAAKANNWTDIAGYWGTDPQTIQQYARAVGASANSFEDLQGAVSKIVMGGKGKEIAELLGVSDVNYANEWDYAMAAMNQLYAMAERGEDMTPIYQQIFGEKKSTKVMDLINDWQTIQELLPQFNGNESGYGMSDQELGTMNDVWTKINTIEEKWNALKENFAAGFGVAALDLMVNVEGTLDGIADYMNATDDAGKQAALDKIRANVEEFFTKLGEIIRDSIHILHDVGMELSESDDPLTAAIGDILVKLSEALQWMVDHQEEVKGALEAIFGVWLVGKLLAVAGQLGAIILQIEAIQAFRGFSAVTGAAEAAGATAGASWGASFGAAVLKAVPWLAGLLTLLDTSNHGSNDLWDENGNPTGENPEITMTRDEFEKTAAAFQAGDMGKIYDENGQRTEIGEAVGAPETKDEAETEQWVRDQAKKYRDAGNIGAEWALYGLFGGGYAGQYTAIQDYWDKYKTGTATTDDWTELNSFFKSEENQNGLISVLKNLYTLDKALEDVPEWAFGLGDGWDAGLPESWRTVTNDWNQGAGSGGNSGSTTGLSPEDVNGFRNVPGQMRAAVREGVSNIKVVMDRETVGRLVAPIVSEYIAQDVTG